MIRRMILAVALAVATLARTLFAGEEKTELAALFPGETLFYVEAGGNGDAQDWKQTALGKIWAEPQVQEFAAAPLAELDKYIKMGEELTGLKFAMLKSCFGNRAAFGMAVNLEQKTMYVAVVGVPADGAQAASLVAAIPTAIARLNPGIGADKVKQDAKGATLIRLKRDVALRLESKNGALVVGLVVSDQGLEEFPASGSLNIKNNFIETMSGLGSGNLLRGFVNTAAILDLIKTAEQADPELQQALAVIEKLGLAGVKGLGFSAAPIPPAWVNRTFVYAPEPRKGLLALSKPEQVSKELLAAVPEFSGYFSACRCDLGGLMNVVREALYAAGVKKEEVDQALGQAMMIAGFHPENDLLNLLGDEMALVALPSAKAGGFPFLGLNQFGIVVKVKDAEKVKSSMEKLKTLGAMAAAANPLGGSAFAKALKDANISGVNLANLLVFSYAMRGDHLIFSLNPRVVEILNSTMAGETKSILANPQFAEAVKSLDTKTGCGVSFCEKPEFGTSLVMPMDGLNSIFMLSAIGQYLSFSRMEQRMEPPMMMPARPENDGNGVPDLNGDDGVEAFMRGPVAMTEEEEVLTFIRKLLDFFPLYKLPPADCLNQHLLPTASVSRLNEKGILFEKRSALPLGLTALGGDSGSAETVAVISIIAAIAIPNLLESRMQANEANAVAALKQYSVAQAIFMKANYGGVAANGLQAKQYCPDFSRLGGENAYVNGGGNKLELIPSVFAEATSPAIGYQGYFFINAKVNYTNEYGLYAVPCVYEKTGINTYYIDGKGTVFMKDLGGELPNPEAKPDNTWVIP